MASELAGIEDYHVHSTWSDDAQSSLEENLAAASAAGLRTICCVEHVRRTSTFVPRFVAAVGELEGRFPLEVLVGVEAKLLDASGALDLPAGLTGLDHVLVADHQMPLGDRCATPHEVRAMRAAGAVRDDELVEGLVEATAAAVTTLDRPLLAHLFSILPKVGIDEATVPGAAVDHLAAALARVGGLVEANEKWACPSAATLGRFAAAGVRVVTSTDAHHCGAVGRYRSAPARRAAALAEAAVRAEVVACT